MYVFNDMFLNGGKKLKKEGRLARFLFIHIIPLSYSMVATPFSKQSEIKKNV
ncbi:Uncharacterised protein [uncultured archaeon]|nr:Uncharacterised protein [uncultured archaeon]